MITNSPLARDVREKIDLLVSVRRQAAFLGLIPHLHSSAPQCRLSHQYLFYSILLLKERIKLKKIIERWY